MRRTALVIPLLCALHVQAQYDSRNLTPATDAATEERFDCDKLRLYPIMANDVFREANADMGRVVPLNKALQDGRLKIKEHGEGATVNTLQAINTSNDTIYLMQGEVVVGGQQDRMLAQDVLVLPGATMDIGAFCVEHGRWSENGTGQGFHSTIGVADQQVRKAAAVEGEQTEVWDAVAKDMQVNGTRSASGSYAHLMQDEEFQAERKRYRERLLGLPSAVPGVVGVIAVSGNKVVGCDVFATEALFAQAYPQLIDAYIAEALNNGSAVTMTSAQVVEYFGKLFAEEDELEKKTEGSGYLFKSKGRTYRVSKF